MYPVFHIWKDIVEYNSDGKGIFKGFIVIYDYYKVMLFHFEKYWQIFDRFFGEGKLISEYFESKF